MRKVFHFDSPRDGYRSDATVLFCFDHRFDVVSHKLLQRLGVTHPDIVKIAGAAKALASPDAEFERQFVLDQIRKSVRLHATERIILTLHSDCGAYGGLAGRFQGDTGAETAHYRAEFARAAQVLREALPGLKVDCYLLNFEGAWLVDESEPEPA